MRVSSDPKFTPIPCNIGQYRQGKNLTIREAAEKVGIAAGSYGTIESGHSLPSKKVLDNLCKLYRCQPEDLYDDYFVFSILAYWNAVKAITAIVNKEDEDEVK